VESNLRPEANEIGKFSDYIDPDKQTAEISKSSYSNSIIREIAIVITGNLVN
jgi:hypothetical protein